MAAITLWKPKRMQIQVTGKNLDIGQSLRTQIEEKVSAHVNKYYDRAISVHVTVEKQKSSFDAECVLHLATGLTLNSTGTGGDAYSSFDMCLEHLEKRLRRYKRRLKNHHRERQNPIPRADVASYVIASEKTEVEEEEADELSPVIIAETSHEIAQLSVGEAVMKLDLSDSHFVLFKKDESGQVNIVYRRNDGNVGWIDPGNTPKS